MKLEGADLQDGGDQQHEEECGEVESGTAAEPVPQDSAALHTSADASNDAETAQPQQVKPMADSRPQPLQHSAGNKAGNKQLSGQQSAAAHPSVSRQGPCSPRGKPAHGSHACSAKHGASAEFKRAPGKNAGMSVQTSQQQSSGRASAGTAAARPAAEASETCHDGLACQAKASAAASAEVMRAFAGNASCSRETAYHGRPERTISPGKRTIPDDAAAHATQEPFQAKRVKRDMHSRAEQQSEHARLDVKPAAQAASGQDLQNGQLVGRLNRDSPGSKSALTPASVSHLLSEENVRNSHNTTCAQVHGSASPSGSLLCLAGVVVHPS